MSSDGLDVGVSVALPPILASTCGGLLPLATLRCALAMSTKPAWQGNSIHMMAKVEIGEQLEKRMSILRISSITNKPVWKYVCKAKSSKVANLTWNCILIL